MADRATLLAAGWTERDGLWHQPEGVMVHACTRDPHGAGMRNATPAGFTLSDALAINAMVEELKGRPPLPEKMATLLRTIRDGMGPPVELGTWAKVAQNQGLLERGTMVLTERGRKALERYDEHVRQETPS